MRACHKNQAGYMGMLSMTDLSLQDSSRLRELTFAFDEIGDAVFLISQQGSLCYTNALTSQLLEYSQAELSSLNNRRLLPDFSYEWWREHWNALQAVKSFSYIVKNLSKSGQQFEAVITARKISLGEAEYSLEVLRKLPTSNAEEGQPEQLNREHYLRTLLDNFPFMVWLKDKDSRLLAANKAYAKMAGVATTYDLEGKTDFDFFPAELAQQYVDGDNDALNSDAPIGVICPIRDTSGEYYWIESYKSSLVVENQVVGTLGYARDVTETLQREREYHSLISNFPNSIVRYNRQNKRTFLNAKTADFYGVTCDFLVGKSPSEYPGGASAVEFESHIQEVFAAGINKNVDLHWQTPDGKERIIHTSLIAELDPNGEVMAVIAMAHDVTETVESQARIHHLAYFDSLTELPNRALLADRISQTMAEADRNKHPFSLMMLDLDRFKEINDSYGHTVGDQLLCEAARRLEKRIRSYDTIARLGGDEFAILLSEIHTPRHASNVGQKIIEAMAEPFYIGGKELFITVSIGIAVFPTDSHKVEDLLKYADSALYSAKSKGRNNFQFYSSDLTEKTSVRLSIENALRKALQKDEFKLYYQPQVDLITKEVVGAEALIRWHKNHSELVPPDQFIGIAEESGLIISIGEWVLYTACKAAVQWNLGRAIPFTVSINLSTRQFIHNDLFNTVMNVLAETGCKPEWVKLEITESLLLEDNEAIQSVLQAFHNYGLNISIDDFGTGYSALSYLNRFPISQLKIDRSFIKDITTNPERGLIVQAIVSMARSLRKGLIAEGVETEEQAQYLAEIGCPHAQGYLFGKPVPFEQMIIADV
jgi:diguanylate cyclase (GGDEF)-like protein/PAS domain S-box-containing protein